MLAKPILCETIDESACRTDHSALGRRAVWLAVGLLATVGCVERRMTIRSDPPGALAVVDGRELGFTPVSTGFLYYGTRRVQLIKDGHETLTVMEKVNPPWYQVFPIEFVADVLIPWRIHDERELYYRLEPQRVAPTDQLLRRAEELRQQSQSTAIPEADPADWGPLF
jgi:hypothetical protein